MTEFTFSLIFLSIPGLLAYYVISQLTSGAKSDGNIDKILKIFVLSVVSYSFYGIVESTWNLICGQAFNSNIFNDLMGSQSLQLFEIVGGAIFGVIFGLSFSYTKNNNFFHRVAQKWKITNKYGDNDVWSFFLNADFKELEQDENENTSNDSVHKWVFVRDLKERLLFYGYVSVWSDTHSNRELIISNVDVFDNDDSTHLYKADHVYISRNIDDIIIEVPNLESLKTEK